MSKIVISLDDVNQTIYKYLLENGYRHAAYALECEAKLDPEKINKRRIPPYFLT